MTEPRKIIIACMDAEDLYRRGVHGVGRYGVVNDWHIEADKRDHRGTQWVYKAWHPKIPGLMLRGTRDEIVQGIVSEEMKESR